MKYTIYIYIEKVTCTWTLTQSLQMVTGYITNTCHSGYSPLMPVTLFMSSDPLSRPSVDVLLKPSIHSKPPIRSAFFMPAYEKRRGVTDSMALTHLCQKAVQTCRLIATITSPFQFQTHYLLYWTHRTLCLNLLQQLFLLPGISVTYIDFHNVPSTWQTRAE